MRVLYQWATLTPSDWLEVDAARWVDLAKKPAPPPRNLDDDGGWVNRVCVQGVEFTADWYAVEPWEDGCRVTAVDVEADRRKASVWTFRPLAPDPAFGGRYNTRQTKVVYAGQAIRDWYDQMGSPVDFEVRPWVEFPRPDETLIRYGVTMPQALYGRHEGARRQVGWREWTEGIPAGHIHQGRVM